MYNGESETRIAAVLRSIEAGLTEAQAAVEHVLPLATVQEYVAHYELLEANGTTQRTARVRCLRSGQLSGEV